MFLPWICALVVLQVSVWDDREHSSAVRKCLEGVVGLRPQPEHASARPLWLTPAGRSVSVLTFTASQPKKNRQEYRSYLNKYLHIVFKHETWLCHLQQISCFLCTVDNRFVHFSFVDLLSGLCLKDVWRTEPGSVLRLPRVPQSHALPPAVSLGHL